MTIFQRGFSQNRKDNRSTHSPTLLILTSRVIFTSATNGFGLPTPGISSRLAFERVEIKIWALYYNENQLKNIISNVLLCHSLVLREKVPWSFESTVRTRSTYSFPFWWRWPITQSRSSRFGIIWSRRSLIGNLFTICRVRWTRYCSIQRNTCTSCALNTRVNNFHFELPIRSTHGPKMKKIGWKMRPFSVKTYSFEQTIKTRSRGQDRC